MQTLTNNKTKEVLSFLTDILIEHNYKIGCMSYDKAITEARKIITPQELEDTGDIIDKVFVDTFIGPEFLGLTTKPLIHTKITDPDYNRNPEKKYDCGRAIVQIFKKKDYGRVRINFTNPEFIYGHTYEDGEIKGFVSCWGAYKDFESILMNKGPSQALNMIYSFCLFSRYGTHWISDKKGVAYATGHDYKGWPSI